MDISIIIPSINPKTWSKILYQIAYACIGKTYEVIAVGPFFPPIELEQYKNFKYIRDFGSPARSFQLGSTVAIGKYITWVPDDALVEPSSYTQSIYLMDSKNRQDGMAILYSEGQNFNGYQHLDTSYWISQTHESLRLPQIDGSWKIAPIFLYNLDFFREIGGLDCRFEHINMNTHDLAYRVQKNGGIIYSSPSRVLKLDWHPWTEVNKSPIQVSFEENDFPLFKRMFSDSSLVNPLKIDYNNWRLSEPFWKRRYKDE